MKPGHFLKIPIVCCFFFLASCAQYPTRMPVKMELPEKMPTESKPQGKVSSSYEAVSFWWRSCERVQYTALINLLEKNLEKQEILVALEWYDYDADDWKPVPNCQKNYYWLAGSVLSFLPPWGTRVKMRTKSTVREDANKLQLEHSYINKYADLKSRGQQKILYGSITATVGALLLYAHSQSDSPGGGQDGILTLPVLAYSFYTLTTGYSDLRDGQITDRTLNLR